MSSSPLYNIFINGQIIQGKCSSKTLSTIKRCLGTLLMTPRVPGEEFWDSEKTIDLIQEYNYFPTPPDVEIASADGKIRKEKENEQKKEKHEKGSEKKRK